MKVLFLIGNAAVGKMTVGQELMKITDLRLFHNHMMIEPVIEIFGYFYPKAIYRLREVIFEEFAATECYGLIFTILWAFDMQSDWEYIEHIKDIFKKNNKRDIDISNQRLLNDDANHRCESYDGEITFENYIKINNSYLAPDVVAKKIKERFNL